MDHVFLKHVQLIFELGLFNQGHSVLCPGSCGDTVICKQPRWPNPEGHADLVNIHLSVETGQRLVLPYFYTLSLTALL